MISPEAQVMLAICAFYAYDACMPLAADAGLLWRSGRAGWRGMLAIQGFEVRWAYLAWPTWLQPHQPAYALRWHADRVDLPGDGAAVQRLRSHAASFRGFALPLYGLGAALFLVLPATLFLQSGAAAPLAAAALVYLFAGWIALRTWRHGRAGHSPRTLARSVAVQSVLCPPFALNAVRKLAAAGTPDVDLLQAACALLDTPDWQALAHRAHALIEAEIDTARADGHNGRLERLERARHQLQAHRPPPSGTQPL